MTNPEFFWQIYNYVNKTTDLISRYTYYGSRAPPPSRFGTTQLNSEPLPSSFDRHP